MPPAGFEPTFPTTERPQTHTLSRTATGICSLNVIKVKFICLRSNGRRLGTSRKEILDRKSGKHRIEKLFYFSLPEVNNYSCFLIIICCIASQTGKCLVAERHNTVNWRTLWNRILLPVVTRKVDSVKSLRWRHDVSESQFENCFCCLTVLMVLDPTFRSPILAPFLVFFASRAAQM